MKLRRLCYRQVVQMHVLYGVAVANITACNQYSQWLSLYERSCKIFKPYVQHRLCLVELVEPAAC